MAEEKIRVLVAKDPCEKCKLKPCARKCMFSQMYEKGPAIAKSEAIEKIAKALCADDVIREGYYQMAEAALNALLEE